MMSYLSNLAQAIHSFMNDGTVEKITSEKINYSVTNKREIDPAKLYSFPKFCKKESE